MGRCLKERLQKEDKGGHIVLESIMFSLRLRYKVGPQGELLNPLGGARLRQIGASKMSIKKYPSSCLLGHISHYIKIVLPGKENAAGRRRGLFQY